MEEAVGTPYLSGKEEARGPGKLVLEAREKELGAGTGLATGIPGLGWVIPYWISSVRWAGLEWVLPNSRAVSLLASFQVVGMGLPSAALFKGEDGPEEAGR